MTGLFKDSGYDPWIGLLNSKGSDEFKWNDGLPFNYSEFGAEYPDVANYDSCVWVSSLPYKHTLKSLKN